jgi:hypothetical protein
MNAECGTAEEKVKAKGKRQRAKVVEKMQVASCRFAVYQSSHNLCPNHQSPVTNP